MNDAQRIYINDKLSIPLAEVAFRFSTAGGPGGQHVNKVESQVTLRFNVEQSPSLTGPMRQRLREKLASRLDKNGILQLSVQETRSQHQNRQVALERFRLLLAEALRPGRRRRPTRPGRAAHERRLAAKKRRGRIKRERHFKGDMS
jgi:ribosome-associated protein